jgi:hypothetical protein
VLDGSESLRLNEKNEEEPEEAERGSHLSICKEAETSVLILPTVLISLGEDSSPDPLEKSPGGLTP